MKVCRYCGGSEEEGHQIRAMDGDICPIVADEMDPTVSQRTPSSLRPPRPTTEGRHGVLHQSASTATTYTTESRGRGCRLQIPPRLLKPDQGTMTREEYLDWVDRQAG